MKPLTGIVFSTLLLSYTVVAFQNCSKGFRSNESTADSSSLNGNPASSSPGAGNPGGGAPAGACMFQAANDGTISALVNPPALRTSYSSVTRTAASQFLTANTSVTIITSSDCTTQADFLTPGKCMAEPSCTAHPSLMITVTLKCSKTSNTTNSCDLFASQLNQDLALSDPAVSALVSIAAIASTNACDTTGVSSSNYFLPFATTPTGTIRIASDSAITDGGTFSVTLTGVTLEKNGSDAAHSVTLAGTFAGEVVSPVACTP